MISGLQTDDDLQIVHSHAVPVRGMPRLRTCIGIVRSLFRGSIFLSERDSSRCSFKAIEKLDMIICLGGGSLEMRATKISKILISQN